MRPRRHPTVALSFYLLFLLLSLVSISAHPLPPPRQPAAESANSAHPLITNFRPSSNNDNPSDPPLQPPAPLSQTIPVSVSATNPDTSPTASPSTSPSLSIPPPSTTAATTATTTTTTSSANTPSSATVAEQPPHNDTPPVDQVLTDADAAKAADKYSKMSILSVIHPALHAAFSSEKASEKPVASEPLTKVEYHSFPLRGTESRDRAALGLISRASSTAPSSNSNSNFDPSLIYHSEVSPGQNPTTQQQLQRIAQAQAQAQQAQQLHQNQQSPTARTESSSSFLNTNNSPVSAGSGSGSDFNTITATVVTNGNPQTVPVALPVAVAGAQADWNAPNTNSNSNSNPNSLSSSSSSSSQTSAALEHTYSPSYLHTDSVQSAYGHPSTTTATTTYNKTTRNTDHLVDMNPPVREATHANASSISTTGGMLGLSNAFDSLSSADLGASATAARKALESAWKRMVSTVKQTLDSVLPSSSSSSSHSDPKSDSNKQGKPSDETIKSSSKSFSSSPANSNKNSLDSKNHDNDNNLSFDLSPDSNSRRDYSYSQQEVDDLVSDIMLQIQMHQDEMRAHRDMLRSAGRWDPNYLTPHELEKLDGSQILVLRSNVLVSPDQLADAVTASTKKLLMAKGSPIPWPVASRLLVDVHSRLAQLVEPHAFKRSLSQAHAQARTQARHELTTKDEGVHIAASTGTEGEGGDIGEGAETKKTFSNSYIGKAVDSVIASDAQQKEHTELMHGKEGTLDYKRTGESKGPADISQLLDAVDKATAAVGQKMSDSVPDGIVLINTESGKQADAAAEYGANDTGEALKHAAEKDASGASAEQSIDTNSLVAKTKQEDPLSNGNAHGQHTHL